MFIKDMLREELKNSIVVKQGYEQAIRELPRGSLVRKKVGGREYFYLAYREAKRVRFDYKGKLGEAEVKRYEDAKIYRARYRHQLSEVKKQIRFIRKVLRGKDSV